MSTIIDFTLTQVRDAAKHVVDRQGPDFVYAVTPGYTCYYQPDPDNDQPAKRETGCLVGEILLLLGFDTTGLVGTIGGMQRKQTITTNWETFEWLDQDALEYLQVLQESQDTGNSWGDALAAAEKNLVTV